MDLGKKIKTLRLRAGLTQEQLADKIGVAPQSVSKWENAAALPDITLLPRLAEIFGIMIDDLFDLSAEQRMNRIENRLDVENEIPQEVFLDYEEYLKSQLSAEGQKKRATELIAYLYWHRMHSFGDKVRRYSREAIRSAPNEKVCQWMLGDAEKHFAWDWNIHNHTKAIDFYRELVSENPAAPLPYTYLIDNLIADRRADEAEACIEKYAALPDAKPLLATVYRAHVALARFNEPEADRIMDELMEENPDDFLCLFEAAQYWAGKCRYEKAIGYYERSFALETRRPRYTDELQAIADIYEIMGDYKKAAATCDRIIDLLKNEWGFTEEVALKDAEKEKSRLLILISD